MKYSIINRENEESIPLECGDVTIIGRGTFGINDKRISKNHGEISCTDGDNQIKIKSCHKNPIFYKKNNNNVKEILYEHTEVFLCNDEAFFLLPDSHEFTVKICDDTQVESTTSTSFRVRNITEINENLECGEMAVTLSQALEEPPLAENQPLVSSSSSSLPKERKRSHSDNENPVENQEETKKLKIEATDTTEEPPSVQDIPTDIVPAACSSSAQIPSTSVTIKPDPDSTNSNQQSNSTMPSVSNVKQEPDSSSVKTEPASNNPQQPPPPPAPQPISRRSCDFGVRCFRHTPEHRREFAHPGEVDYRRPAYPPAVPNSPRCPFWESCYRRNPDHFRMFEHPSSAALYNPIQPPPAQPRQPVINYNYDEDMDDEEEDIFYDSDDTDVDRDYEIDGESVPEEEEDENNLEE